MSIEVVLNAKPAMDASGGGVSVSAAAPQELTREMDGIADFVARI